MNTTTKGAAAAGAAAVLLLGGAGSLAYWTSSASLNGGSITTGSLKLTGVSCDTAWKYNNGSSAGATVSAQGIVPGDQITKSCTFTVTGSGDHLTATPTVPGTLTYTTTTTGGAAAPTTLSLPVAASYTLGTAPLAAGDTITEGDTGKTLTAKIVVTMPFGNAAPTTPGVNQNDTQGLTNTLNALTVTLTQTSPSGGENPNA